MFLVSSFLFSYLHFFLFQGWWCIFLVSSFSFSTFFVFHDWWCGFLVFSFIFLFPLFCFMVSGVYFFFPLFRFLIYIFFFCFMAGGAYFLFPLFHFPISTFLFMAYNAFLVFSFALSFLHSLFSRLVMHFVFVRFLPALEVILHNSLLFLVFLLR